jgi:hypothetical protein
MNHGRGLGVRIGLGLVALAACASEPASELPDADSRVVTFEYSMDVPTPRIDLLVVVDSSPAIAVHRDRLVASYRRFGDVLQTIGGPPDLRVGVVTADLGGPGCGPGDDGAFRRTAVVAGDFLVDYPLSSSTRGRNYAGDLGTALAALADAGSAGCATTQPLAAMKRALERPAGFHRPNAILAVLFVSASDDSSALSIDEAAAALPPLGAREVIVSVIGGPEGDACATPSTRLQELAARVPFASSFTSICAAEHQDAFAILGLSYRSFLNLPCLDGIADVDPVAPGRQYECTVSDIYPDPSDEGREVEQSLEACNAAVTNRPCWHFVQLPNFGCLGDTLEVERPFLPVLGTRTVGQCIGE